MLNRSSRDDEPKRSVVKDDVKKEVKKFFEQGYVKKGKIPESELQALRLKYKNEEVLDKIYEEIDRSEKHITRKIQKFADYLMRKMANNTPMNEIIKKALSYKHKMTDYEFDEFYRLVQKKIATGEFGQQSDKEAMAPRTKLNKYFGSMEIDYYSKKMEVSVKDMPILQDILKEYNKMLHSDVQLNSLTYEEGDVQALSGNFNKEKHQASVHIHPLIFAMFITKIKYFEKHCVYGSIANIIKHKKDGTMFKTKSDMDLFYDIIYSIDDIVCDADNVLADLRSRARVQNKLWNCILKLRSGLYYDKVAATEFLLELDGCKLNNYDAPDLLYTQDEGTILRKIMAIFGMRPTLVETKPGNNLQVPVFENHYNTPRKLSITKISMVICRLSESKGKQLSLENELTKESWFLEHKTMVMKTQKVLASSGVLIFYVPRKRQALSMSKYKVQNTPIASYKELPLTIISDTEINPTEIEVQDNIPLQNPNDENKSSIFTLKSVVVASVISLKNNKEQFRSAGCAGLAVIDNVPGDIYSGKRYIMYDPVNARNSDLKDGKVEAQPPITSIKDSMDEVDPDSLEEGQSYHDRGFSQLACKFGTIFIYVNEKKDD